MSQEEPDSLLISVVMPLYNGEAFLEKAVKSVINQTYQDWELLIIDDGSTDAGYPLARQLADQDKRIRVLQHPGGKNCGVSLTRNLGINSARGEYIALLDCDDVWLPEKLARQVAILNQYPEVVLTYSKAQVVDETDQPVIEYPNKLSQRFLPQPVFGNGFPIQPVQQFCFVNRSQVQIPASSVIFSRKAAIRCGNFTAGLPYQFEDALFFTQLTAEGAMYFLNEVLVGYRVHGSQWSSILNDRVMAEKNFLFYYCLLDKVQPQYKGAVVKKTLNLGVADIIQRYVSFRKFDAALVMSTLGKIFGSKHLSVRHKMKALNIVRKRMVFMLKHPSA